MEYNRNLSIVVQGPVQRHTASCGDPSTDAVLASVRRHFPGAQIVLSTWIGSETKGLDFDDLVQSNDPGSLNHPSALRPCNLNRMVTSTKAGLAAATRPLCIKTRTDVSFRSEALAQKRLQPAARFLSFDRRIWIGSIATRDIVTFFTPYHPSDIVHFGTTADLRQLWDAPCFTLDDVYLKEGRVPSPWLVYKRLPEQCLFMWYLSGLGLSPVLEEVRDGREEVLRPSVTGMLGAFDVFDEAAAGISIPSRIADAIPPWQVYNEATFQSLRSSYARDCEALYREVSRLFRENMRKLIIAWEQDYQNANTIEAIKGVLRSFPGSRQPFLSWLKQHSDELSLAGVP
jgi:hypothetical protein